MTEPISAQDEVLREEALAWVSRIVLGEATTADMESLRRWRDTSPRHAAALAEVGRVWRGVEAAAGSLALTDAVSIPLDEPVGHRPSRRALLVAGSAVAAAAVGLMIVRPPLHLWPSLAELGADYRTSTGEQRHVSLADSVSIEMNTQTSIARTTDAAAGIELISGEVAVTIAPIAPQFVVIAGVGRITAHRGTFNLRRDGATVGLTCIDGQVNLQCDDRSLTLGPAKRVSYDADGLGEVAAADPDVAAWRDGMLVFHDTPLARVVDEVNRYRAGRIILMDAALGRRTVTARIELNRLDTVMLQIRHIFDARVRTLPGGIVLVG
ncbi:FecR family protein [Bradyrhizobium cenepequi]